MNKGELMIYKNTMPNSIIRNTKMIRNISNKSENDSLIFNIYVREKDNNGNRLISKNDNNNDNNDNNNIININSSNNDSLKTIEKKTECKNSISNEDYKDTLNTIYDYIENRTSMNSINLKSFTTSSIRNSEDMIKSVKLLNTYRKNNNNTILNKITVDDSSQKFNGLNPILINDVIDDEIKDILKNYYKKCIDDKVFILGDRQANRYKSHNEGLSRVVHYELLPLIENIVDKKLRPTYTYISFYISEADLPAHTDREDCEFTVSFIIDKPENSTWNMYVDKEKQPIKYKGRYDHTPCKNNCFSVDCNAGGLMLFDGTDHIHFREKTELEFYNIILFHYRSI